MLLSEMRELKTEIMKVAIIIIESVQEYDLKQLRSRITYI
jgi:hypothetical protein